MFDARRCYTLLCCGLNLLVCGRGAGAQGVDANVNAAQALGTAFLKAVQAADWKAAASFLDLVPLDHYRLQQVDMVRRSRNWMGMSVEQLMKADSGMPRAVAEYQVRRMQESRQNFNPLEREFGISDPDSLAALPLSVVAEHWLAAHDPRERLRMAHKVSECPLPPADSLPKPNFRVLGTVVNGSIAYILYERDDDVPVDLNEVRSRGPHMLILRRGLDQWWVLPHQDDNYAVSISVSCSVKTKPK